MAEGPLLRFFRDIGRSSARNNAWPDPFIPADRQAVRAPLATVADNGWRYNNILHDHHFDESGRLNEAGDRMVRTITQEHPTGRRSVYIVRSNEPQITEARFASAYQTVNRYLLPGDVAQVGETVIRPEGWPASFVVAVDRAFVESIPQPRLPARASGSASSSSSSGS